MTNVAKVIGLLDQYMEEQNLRQVSAHEANTFLLRKGALKDHHGSDELPILAVLRRGLIPHAFQVSGPGSEWRIPHSGGDVEQCKI